MIIYLVTSTITPPDGFAPVRQTVRSELLDEIGGEKLDELEHFCAVGAPGKVAGATICSGNKRLILVEVAK
jgi:hypothetical protein